MKAKDTKIHIGIFGRRNNGKSSFVNAISGQDVAIVSDVPGTTTDPVKKSLEIHGFGPCIIIDTAGLDDIGVIGEKRVKKSNEIIEQIDIAVLILAGSDFGNIEKLLINKLNEREIPFIVIYNKVDTGIPEAGFVEKIEKETGEKLVLFSSLHPNIDSFVKALLNKVPETQHNSIDMFSGILKANEIVLLVTPCDTAAPEGRMILPQVQAIRNVLDHGAINIVCKETELDSVLNYHNIKPNLVVTDSQAFKLVSSIVPEKIPLTGFSILLARLKGNFKKYLEGTPAISTLKDGDKILILESCSHHATCEDIGRVKIPKLLREFTGKKLDFVVISGFGNLPEKITDFAMLIQCGACVFTRKQLEGRLKNAINNNVPVSNYGMTLAYVNGIFDRATKIFI